MLLQFMNGGMRNGHENVSAILIKAAAQISDTMKV